MLGSCVATLLPLIMTDIASRPRHTYSPSHRPHHSPPHRHSDQCQLAQEITSICLLRISQRGPESLGGCLMVKCRDSHRFGPWSTCSVALREEKRCCVQKRSSIYPLHQGTERSSCRAERCPAPHGGSADARSLGLVPQTHSSLS